MSLPEDEQETAAVCPIPHCDGGLVERRSRGTEVYYVSCAFCDGYGVVPVWKARQWLSLNPARRKISGIMAKGGF